jgi:heme/copper-type cytochrome/quinol oxidase subunit 2
VLGINNLVITQAGANVTVKPMKAGTYPAHCTSACGAGHSHMAIKFIVSNVAYATDFDSFRYRMLTREAGPIQRSEAFLSCFRTRT